MSTQEYLERARQAGLLDEVLGHRYVADQYDDPISARRQILVEYCDPGLPRDAEALGALRDRLRERHREAEAVLLRVPDGVPLPGPWRPRFTYVRHDRRTDSAPTPADPAVRVRAARTDDDALVHGWLVQAFRNAYPGREVDSLHAGIADIMANRGRSSFIAEVAGEPVGHGTVLTDERDEVTDEAFAELVDILIDDPEHRRAATSALVAAIADATRERRLCGHVVHPHEPSAARQADTVLGALLRTGWSVDHAFWESTW
ncbi:GNAT family N-acetyltransferase [Streptomyces sp. NPDC086787]|uniref:GNAT family N-acetyltransferase n=1 Tax=Streptomyces sp. NPDC086787 TaxID=3365759 RepID=UPI00381120BD